MQTITGTSTMESLEFLCILIVGIVVVGWYCLNESRKADGDLGILALKPGANAQPAKRRGRYRIKPRRAVRSRELRSISETKAVEAASPAYRALEDLAQARRRFRRQDEARYRGKDKISDDFSLRDH